MLRSIDWRTIAGFFGLLILATTIAGFVGGFLRGIYVASGTMIPLWVVVLTGLLTQAGTLLVAAGLGWYQRERTLQHAGILFLLAIALTFAVNVALLRRAAMESVLASGALGVVFALGVILGMGLRSRHSEDAPSILANMSSIVSLGVSAILAMVIATNLGGRMSMPLSELLDMNPHALPAIAEIAAVDRSVHSDLILAADSITIYGDRGLRRDDWLQIFEATFPVIFCNSDAQQDCFGIQLQECRQMIGKAIEACLDHQYEVLPEYVDLGTGYKRVGTAVGVCAGASYEGYYRDTLANTEACRKSIREAMSASR